MEDTSRIDENIDLGKDTAEKETAPKSAQTTPDAPAKEQSAPVAAKNESPKEQAASAAPADTSAQEAPAPSEQTPTTQPAKKPGANDTVPTKTKALARHPRSTAGTQLAKASQRPRRAPARKPGKPGAHPQQAAAGKAAAAAAAPQAKRSAKARPGTPAKPTQPKGGQKPKQGANPTQGKKPAAPKQATQDRKAQAATLDKAGLKAQKVPAAGAKGKGAAKAPAHTAKHKRKSQFIRITKPGPGILPVGISVKPSKATTKEKVIAVAILIYIVGVVFFSFHYLPNTTVNDTNASWRTVSKMAKEYQDIASDYELQVEGKGIDFKVTGADISLAFDQNAFARSATPRFANWLWPVAVFFPHSYYVSDGTSYDKDVLDAKVEAAVESVNDSATSSTNAAIAYDPDLGRYVPIAEEVGTALDEQRVLDHVNNAAVTLHTSLQIDDACLEQPTVSTQDPRFDEAVAAAESYPNISIDLRLSHMVVETVDSDLIQTWLAVGDDYQVTGNLDAIEGWTRGDFSAKVDSVGSIRTYTIPGVGKEVTINDGTYGWNIDGVELAKLIRDRIDQQSTTPIEVPVTSRAAQFNPGGADWGNRYIDVDLTDQYVRMYDESGELIFGSECVSGNEANNDATVTGVFYIEEKESPKTLIGLDNDGDGEPDYENDVEYWMGFYGGYGFHDAVWRSVFDYDTYLYDGSHGCVNLPYYSAELLYSYCKEGDPVVVHY